ncbi:hypothetical protein H8959_007069 [Pygathrix nigripes]
MWRGPGPSRPHPDRDTCGLVLPGSPAGFGSRCLECPSGLGFSAQRGGAGAARVSKLPAGGARERRGRSRRPSGRRDSRSRRASRRCLRNPEAGLSHDAAARTPGEGLVSGDSESSVKKPLESTPAGLHLAPVRKGLRGLGPCAWARLGARRAAGLQRWTVSWPSPRPC